MLCLGCRYKKFVEIRVAITLLKEHQINTVLLRPVLMFLIEVISIGMCPQPTTNLLYSTVFIYVVTRK